ncbi:HigA family addiction module antitoxin [Pseudomonas aeruginosa]|uniref:Addiction module antidote protein, HigA family n=4 Tax=Pseudomonadota TaxID=1224 RepID=A0A235F0J0_9RHOO|nr:MULTISPECIES: HigA family addiction module antitoxin [Pseudomonadaceae]MBP8262220.1 HigA family addiction module antidote protein [Pseudomonas sp.]NHC08608.1 HigA family addiction module antidote protein [Azonexus fungiphilus]NVZ11804.1 HigA family addiction module antidote protein [Allochromatium humboldtianum]OYD54731.1 addiction module antidote protein, HigA family [Thauera propionica]PZQ37970.1 MAG: addiction module antidote protein, HigA family [Pseudomonas putida]WGL65477.1 HigA fami
MPMHNPPHPGEALRLDVLPALGINADALATHLGFSPRHLRAVLNGRLPVRAELAHRLELAGLGSARQYLAEQQAWSLWQARQRPHPPIIRLYP